MSMGLSEIKAHPYVNKTTTFIKFLLSKLEKVPTNLLCLVLFIALFLFLSAEVSAIKKRIRMLDFDVSSIEGDISDIQSNLSGLKNEVTSIDSKLDSLESQVDSIDSTLSSIEIDLRYQ